MKTLTTTAKYISKLAKKNNVSYQETKLGVLAKDITRLAGDEVSLDQTGLLLIALKKAKVVNGQEVFGLLEKHLNEVKHVRSI